MLFNLDRYNATKTVNQTIFYNGTHIDQRPMVKKSVQTLRLILIFQSIFFILVNN